MTMKRTIRLVLIAGLAILPVRAALTAPPPSPASAVFPRAGQAIPYGQVKTLITEDLAGRGYDGDRVDTFDDTAPDLAWAPGETGFRVTSPNGAPRLGPVSFYVETFAGDRPSRTIPVTVWVQLFRDRCVTTKALARGQAVGVDDVTVARVDVNNAADPGFASIEECLGMRVKRSLPAGWMLTARDLERMPAVKRGQKTAVVYRQGGISAVATVEVKSDGWVGDTVPVVNVDSKRAFSARVTGPGQLEAGQ